MTPKQILDSLSETLMQDERILSAQERALLASLLQHVKTTSNTDPEVHEAVSSVIASAVGETVAQRAFAVLGSSIVERILSGTETSDTLKVSMGSPAPNPGPQPPTKPMRGPTPPGPQPPTPPPPPSPRPGKEAPFAPPPPGPQPPTGARPAAVQQKLAQSVVEGHQSVGVLEKPQSLLAKCVVLDEFLAPQEMEELLNYTLEHEADFEIGGVISPADDEVVDYAHRRSRVLMDPGKYESFMADRIKSVLPMVLTKLDMEEFAVTGFESQITASNDGDFFRSHHDNCQKEVASRQLTFVYFFHREPRQFEGGELRLHDARLEEGKYVGTGSCQSIVPQQNQIVFFPCSLLHEITPVKCPSGRFADSRFTLNGWLRR